MALNYPGPYQVRVFYQVDGEPHQFNLNLKITLGFSPGDPFSTIFPDTRAGSNSITLKAHLDALIAAVADRFNSVDASFINAELWEFEPLTFDAIFKSSYTIGVAGTSVVATSHASQSIHTFRTQEGGIMKFVLMGTVLEPGVSVFPPFGAVTQAITDELVGDDQIWLARDTSYPLSPIGHYPGQNERLYKKLFR